ncbi:hypothetical protein [Nocardioides sp. GXZ039]|uniref:hypothetical protein n=1 Tax=Nocardioides sp. GXZ039 TaxID=3136018 RepID=UPI0030F3D691
MKKSTLAPAAAVVVGAALAAGLVQPAPASAAPARARVAVTITADGTDIHGTVTSSALLRCAADRTVDLYKLVDGEPHLWASDTTQLQGRSYVWSAGNTGTTGRFFARVKAKPGCRAATSPTIRVRR